MPLLTSKNLGLVRAIHSNLVAPSNTQMLWYNLNDFKHYYYDVPTTTWKLLASTGSGGSQTLSQTLALGNTTGANDINITAGRKIIFNNSGFTTGLLANPALGVDTTVYLPSQSGTLALISDIPSLAYTANLVIKGTGTGITSGIIYDNGSGVSIGTTTPTAKFTVKSGVSSLGLDILNSSNTSNFSVNDDGIVVARLGYWLNISGINRKVLWCSNGGTNVFVGPFNGQGGSMTSASSNSGLGFRSLYSLTSGYNNNAVGFDALFYHQSGTNNNAFGTSALYNSISGNDNIGIGTFAGYNLDNPSRTISIGGNSEFANPLNPLLTGRSDTIVIGFGNTANASEQFEALIGGNGLKIANLYIGQGRWSNSTVTVGTIKLQITSPISNSNSIGLTAQTDANGVDFAIASSQPTGSGVGGSLLFQVAPGGGASGTAARPLVTTLKLTPTKSIILGTVTTTTATDGFVYIPTAPGVPTGTPTSQSGTAPIVVDTTNNRLYFYSGGTWNYSSGGGVIYSNGAGLNLVGNVFSIATSGVINSMIANSTIDLTSKVTGILPQGNGGTGFATYTKGDLLVGDTGNILVKLGIGSDGQVLTVSGGTAIWSTTSSLGPLASGQIYLGNASNVTALVTPTGDVTISNTGVTAIGAGKVTNTMIVSMAASKLTGVVAANQGGTGISTYNTGDLLYYGSSSFNKLAAGTNGYVLTMVSGVPAWAISGVSSGWNMNGNTVTSEKWFGTIDNFDLPFRTNNIEKARFTTTGRLGIGTIAPFAMLHVKSTTVGGMYLEMGAGTGPAALQIYTSNTTGISSDSGSAMNILLYGDGGGLSYIGGGKGIVIDAYAQNGAEISSFNTAGFFQQSGILTAANTNPTVGIYRISVLGSYDITAPLLDINDGTASTGNLASFAKGGVQKVVIKSTGVLQYIDGNQAAGYVMTSDAAGNASWAAVSGGGGSYTFSTGLTNASGTVTANLSTGVSGGQSVIGGTASGNNLVITSTSNPTKGYIIFGTSVYDEVNNRLGIATGNVPGVYDITLGPNTTRSIGMGRSGTGSGGALSINSGSAVVGGTNFNAGTLQLMTGTSTGDGSGTIEFWAAGGGSSGTADMAPIKRAHLIGNGNWTIGTNSAGGVSVPAARMDVFSAHGTYILRMNNSSLSGNIGWSFENETSSGNNNLIINEHTSTPSTVQRFKWVSGGKMLIGTGSTADASLHVNGTFKLVDGSQGTDKIFRSDANGLGSWITAPWLLSPMTTIADIIQASATVAGGSPARLAGSTTAGTFLRSQGTGVVNHWSTLVLPNAATTGQLMWATGTNTMGMTSEMVWTSAFGTLVVTKSRDGYSTISINNNNIGTSAAASITAISDIADITLVANGSNNTRDGGGARTYLQSSGIDMNIINTNNVPIKFIVNASETVRITSAGVLIGINTAANPDTSCLLDLNSNTKGLRVPRMTTTERNAINITGKPGIIVYDTTTNLLYVSNSSAAWVSL